MDVFVDASSCTCSSKCYICWVQQAFFLIKYAFWVALGPVSCCSSAILLLACLVFIYFFCFVTILLLQSKNQEAKFNYILIHQLKHLQGQLKQDLNVFLDFASILPLSSFDCRVLLSLVP